MVQANPLRWMDQHHIYYTYNIHVLIPFSTKVIDGIRIINIIHPENCFNEVLVKEEIINVCEKLLVGTSANGHSGEIDGCVERYT